VVSVSTSVTFSEAAIAQITRSASGPVWQAVAQAGTTTAGRAKLDLTANRLVNQGLLRNSIESQVSVRGESVVARIGTNVDYARFVHEGTSGPIVPRRARALRFRSGGVQIIRTQVQGTRETGRFSPYLTNALEQLGLDDFT
jgi:hypothetical protein